MTDLYLIAHKVRNEPAFDVATRMECPHCRGATEIETGQISAVECIECDSLGYWWIIPTSGHRAYPFFHCDLPALLEHDPTVGWEIRYGNLFPDAEYVRIGELPLIPDHYPHALAPDTPKRNLIDLLNLRPKSAPTAPFPRRI